MFKSPGDTYLKTQFNSLNEDELFLIYQQSQSGHSVLFADSNQGGQDQITISILESSLDNITYKRHSLDQLPPPIELKSKLPKVNPFYESIN